MGSLDEAYHMKTGNWMKKLIQVIALFGVTLLLNGQDVPDSRRMFLNGKSLEERVDAGLDLASYYQYDQPDSAVYYLEAIHSLIVDSGKEELLGKFLFKIGTTYSRMGRDKIALKFYERGFDLFEQLSDTSSLALCYQRAGFINMTLKKPTLAFDQLMTALKYAESINDVNTASIVFYSLGALSYETNEDKNSALDYFLKAKDIAESEQNNELLIPILGGIGTVYNATGNFEEALKYKFQVLEYYKSKGDHNSVARSLMNIGNTHRDSKKYGSAEQQYLEALQIYQTQNNSAGIINVYINLGILYNKQEQSAKTIAVMRDAMSFAQEHGDQQDRMEIAENMGLAFEQMTMYDSALHYLKYVRMLSDSIQLELEKERYQDLQILYESDLKDKEIAETRALYLENEKQRQKDQFWKILLGLIGLFTTVLAALVYRRFVFKQRTAALLEAKNKEISLAKDRAEKSEQSKQIFLSAMSHEIRTPLNAIIGFSELLQGSNLQHKEQKYVQSLRNASQHLLTLLNTVLDINKLNESELQVNLSVFNTEILKQRLNAIFEYMSQEKGVRWHLESNLPEYLYTDPHRILQIAVNLCSNAVKFTQKGVVEVFLEVLKEGDQPQLIIEVRDTGVGIPAERLEHLFDKFTSNGGSEQSGTGLGLFISRQLAILLNGDIEVSSTPGQGSVFSLVVPVQIPVLEDKPELGIGIRNTSSQTAIQKIFIAEDNAYNQTVIHDLLAKHLPQVSIHFFDNGLALWEALQTDLPDVIIIDRHMPVMDGLELCHKIKSNATPTISNIPIIALSASVTKEEQEEIKKAGADFFLEKPLHIQSLLAILSQWGTVKVVKNETSPFGPHVQFKFNQLQDTRLYEFAEGDTHRMDAEFEKFLLQYKEIIRPQLEDACKNSNLKSIQKRLHDLRPQLRFMGMYTWEAAALKLEDQSREMNCDNTTLSKDCQTFLTNLDQAMLLHKAQITAG